MRPGSRNSREIRHNGCERIRLDEVLDNQKLIRIFLERRMFQSIIIEI
jgi:hypothetical protein